MLKIIIDFLFNSEFFEIKQVRSNIRNIAFDYLLGKNIFKLDLKKEWSFLKDTYPQYLKIRIFKLLPNHLYIELTERQPLAKVSLKDKYLYLDKEAVLFRKEEDIDLPIIRGLEKKIFQIANQRSYNTDELLFCVKVIEQLKSSSLMSNYKIKELFFLGPDDFSIFIESMRDGKTVEIKINEDDFEKKIKLLPIILSRINLKEQDIRYIDLRFKDPLIRLNEE